MSNVFQSFSSPFARWFVLQGEFGDISTLAEPKVVDDLLEKAKEAA